MSESSKSVLLFLESCIAPIPAKALARCLQLPEEDVYAVLVGLYDNGLARIARQPRTGDVAGWEAA